jgi:hypothetical protein
MSNLIPSRGNPGFFFESNRWVREISSVYRDAVDGASLLFALGLSGDV